VMYNGHVSRDAVAQAARDVLAAWQAGDVAATAIVTGAVQVLAARVDTVARRLELKAPLVCFTGGVSRSASFVDALARGIEARCPGAVVEPAKLGPAAGAILLAWQADGLDVNDSMRRQLLTTAIEGHT